MKEMQDTAHSVSHRRMSISDYSRASGVSFNQEQICLLEAFYPLNQAYNFQATVEIEGDLSLPILEKAISHVIERHEMLRTTIGLEEKGYQATIHPPYDYEIQVHDFTALGPSDRDKAIKALFHRYTDRAFDVAKLPLLDIQAVHISAHKWLLIQVEHHVVHDGWSLGKIWQEIQDAYNAYADGVEPALPDLPAHYQQFVAWQRSRMEGDYGKAALDFWHKYLEGATSDIELGRRQLSGASLGGHNLELTLPVTDCVLLRERAQALSVSEFVLMFAVFARLLEEKSGANDFTIGTAVNARTERQLEPIIGMVVNTIPIRVRPREEKTFGALCRHVQTSLFQTLRYQDVPLSLIVRRLGVSQQRGRNPVFQHCFSFHDSLVPKLELKNARGDVKEAQNQASKFDINVIVMPPRRSRGPEAARMFWQFSKEVFSQDEAHQLSAEYIGLLRNLLEVEDP